MHETRGMPAQEASQIRSERIVPCDRAVEVEKRQPAGGASAARANRQ
jgi:hypothetical protein